MKKTVNERIEEAIRKRPNASDREISKNLQGITSLQVQRFRESGEVNLEAETPLSGISLSSKMVLSHKPAPTASLLIQRLPKGRGFEPKDLSKQWHLSEETIRSHAKKHGALKYVEVSPGEWIPVVMNPQTAEAYN
jgi:hypothetical protein